MTPILSRANAKRLSELARAKPLLAFDFDGTLAPIVARRDGAALRESTRRLLGRLSRCYECAVISGRSRADTSRRLAGTGIEHIVGNHGLEPSRGIEQFRRAMERTALLLEAEFRSRAGIELENKRYSLAVHYRAAPAARAARRAIQEAVRRLPVALRQIGGKRVINLVPENAPTKGDALVRLMKRTQSDCALYVGDDVTDEDVFELAPSIALVTVRVGTSKRSHACYYLHNQNEIDWLLTRLLALKSDATHRNRPKRRTSTRR